MLIHHLYREHLEPSACLWLENDSVYFVVQATKDQVYRNGAHSALAEEDEKHSLDCKTLAWLSLWEIRRR